MNNKDLCESCKKSGKNGTCPIWPTIRVTTKCIEYTPKEI